ncbi:protein SUPPRESSOR OF K(+) TRANSPORT GROWTH DEFECT 1-like [Quercus robur]|uniref:protein SUPPRESSOR OF K(+) TRANSPORT GROWTH DEFECT 1-like n=1 Tax=Quercus robur TaxID=38942 RepID=UPI002163E3DC|nr:protein SUPPRESSOR OF K(+) TRANSPORT GROWTH DEFECT 1-like [Quercus robur]
MFKHQQQHDSTVSSPKSSHFEKLSNVKLDDVGGLEVCKQLLKEAAIWPVKYSKFFTGNRKPLRTVLLFGPPGSGKTLLAKAIAAEANSYFSRISPSDIVSEWMGKSEQHVKDLFKEAREKAPSIIFIDEIDCLCGPRGENNENEASRRIKSELLVHMQDVEDGEFKVEKHVLILAATNTPYALDQALRRRFDMRIYIPLPDYEARKRIFEVQIGETPNSIAKEELKHLAKDTEGFSGSDISYYVKDALYQSIRSTLEKLEKDGQNSKIQVPNVTIDHFKDVEKKHKRTVTEADLNLLEKFHNEFGSTLSNSNGTGQSDPGNPELDRNVERRWFLYLFFIFIIIFLSNRYPYVIHMLVVFFLFLSIFVFRS